LSRATVLGLALTLFVVISGLRLASEDPTAQIATFLLLPIALLGMEFGVRGGLLSALAAMGVVFVWLVARDVDLGVVGVLERCVPLALLGAFFGVLGTRLSQAVSDRALIADQIVYMEGLTGHGLIRLDPFGSITAWNPEAAGLLGFSAADAESHSMAMIFGGETGAESALGEMLRGALHHGHHSEERWLTRKDGARRLTAISVTPLGARGTAGFAVVLRDLTASKAVLHGSSRMWEVSLEMLATASFDGYIQHANPRWTEILAGRWKSSKRCR
jgi:PAS domain S-box-containing protein